MKHNNKNIPLGIKPKEKKPKEKKPVFERLNKDYFCTFRFFDSKGRRLSIFARPSGTDRSIILTILKLSKEPNEAPGDLPSGPKTGLPDRFSKVRAKEIYEKEYLPYVMAKTPGTDYKVELQEDETISKCMLRWARENCSVPVEEQITIIRYRRAKFLPKPEKKLHYTVYLVNAGPNKLMIVKTVKDLTGLGLRESKDLVDSTPSIIKSNISKAEAQGLIDELRSHGAEMEMK